MPLRPSILPFRIGTDIVQIQRIRDLIGREGGAKERLRTLSGDGIPGEENSPKKLNQFIQRIFTPWERNHFLSKFPIIAIFNNQLRPAARHLSGRFAAKEAVMKAFPGRALRLQDIEIRVAPGNGGRTGAPYAVILDKPTSSEIPAEHEGDSTEAIPEDVAASDVTASETDVDGQIVHISISHDGDYATAVCIAPEEPTPGDVGGEAAARGL